MIECNRETLLNLMVTIWQGTSLMIECHCKTLLNWTKDILSNVNVLDVFSNEAFDLP